MGNRAFPGLHPAKERLERQIHSHGHVLQHLAMHSGQHGLLLFEIGQVGLLGIEANGNGGLFPVELALLQQRVVGPAAGIQRVAQACGLGFRGVDTVEERFAHRATLSWTNEWMRKPR
jgi:hypothetical protein